MDGRMLYLQMRGPLREIDWLNVTGEWDMSVENLELVGSSFDLHFGSIYSVVNEQNLNEIKRTLIV